MMDQLLSHEKPGKPSGMQAPYLTGTFNQDGEFKRFMSVKIIHSDYIWITA
jgi:hypothetical protein